MRSSSADQTLNRKYSPQAQQLRDLIVSPYISYPVLYPAIHSLTSRSTHSLKCRYGNNGCSFVSESACYQRCLST